jgi:ubiquinone/menaquinone biosynthesis C-methylase UbiE
MNKDPYKNFANKYDKIIEPFNTVVRQIGMKMFLPEEEMLILDVGCGTGTNLSLYQKAGCKVFGIDLSPSMLEVARKKLGERADLRLGDAAEMPYPKNSFDLVIAFLTLHEMPGDIRPAVMNEIVRLSKSDGRILLIDYHPGPIRFPMGWWYKSVILFFEILAGREHFRNYRDFLAQNGLPELITAKSLKVEDKKIISKGNMAIFLLSLEKG